MICAFEATDDTKFLDRALSLAGRVCVELAGQAQEAPTRHLIWEHYDSSWTLDYEYNLDDKQHLIRPWGFLPGHSAEWAKLLCLLHRIPEAGAPRWIPDIAQHLFQHAEDSWDESGGGGMFYTYGPDGRVCDRNKYMWPQVEAFAAALLLHKMTGEEKYLK